MIPFPEYLLWIGATLLAGYVAALSWRLGVARYFPLLTTYLVLSLFAGLARWVTLARAMGPCVGIVYVPLLRLRLGSRRGCLPCYP
jgi:hypothetical protein